MRFTCLIITSDLTLDRSAWLDRCLSSLASSPIEIRVLINGKNPASRDVCERWLHAGLKLRYRERWEPIAPPAARNLLWASIPLSDRTRDHWILFLDDDAFIEPSAFTQIIDTLRTMDADIVGGPNLTPPQSSTYAHAVGVALASRFTTLISFRRWRRADPHKDPAHALSQPCNEESLTLCNLWVRASILTDGDAPQESPFLPEFFYGEETRLIERLSADGARVTYLPTSWVWHERKSTPLQLARQVFRSARGRAIGQRWGLLTPKAAPLLPSAALVFALIVLATWPRGYALLFTTYGVAIFLATVRSITRDKPLGSIIRRVWIGLCALTVPPIIHFSYALGYLAGWITLERQQLTRADETS